LGKRVAVAIWEYALYVPTNACQHIEFTGSKEATRGKEASSLKEKKRGSNLTAKWLPKNSLV